MRGTARTSACTAFVCHAALDLQSHGRVPIGLADTAIGERGKVEIDIILTEEQQASWLAELEATGAFQRDDWEHGQLVAELVERFQFQRLSGRWLPPVVQLSADQAASGGGTTMGRWGASSSHVPQAPAARRRRSAYASAVREDRGTPLQRVPLKGRRSR